MKDKSSTVFLRHIIFQMCVNGCLDKYFLNRILAEKVSCLMKYLLLGILILYPENPFEGRGVVRFHLKLWIKSTFKKSFYSESLYHVISKEANHQFWKDRCGARSSGSDILECCWGEKSRGVDFAWSSKGLLAERGQIYFFEWDFYFKPCRLAFDELKNSEGNYLCPSVLFDWIWYCIVISRRTTIIFYLITVSLILFHLHLLCYLTLPIKSNDSIWGCKLLGLLHLAIILKISNIIIG